MCGHGHFAPHTWIIDTWRAPRRAVSLIFYFTPQALLGIASTGVHNQGELCALLA